MMYESLLFLEDDAAYTVDSGRHALPVKLSDILVSLGTETVTRILVDTKVKLSAVLNHCLIERRKEHMILIVHLGDGDDEQSMVLSRIAVNNG